MAERNVIDGNANPLARLTATEFEQKFPTKKDIWRFLSSEVRWYLPHPDTVTIWHLRDLARGLRTHIKCADVKVIQIPQYKGLSVEDILTTAKLMPEVMRALPEQEKEIYKLPREYIGNVIFTIVGEDF